MATPVENVPSTALVVYAHPDDPEVSCGGTVARWATAGCEVHVVICTNGDKGSTDPTMDRDALVHRRAQEVAEAAAVMGVAGHHFLGYADGEIENTNEVRRQLVALVRQLRPQIVVCPDPTAVFFGSSYFNHRDHREVGWATLDAVAPACANPHYFPEAGSPHQVESVYLSGTLEPDLWVEITSTIEIKAQALLCHASQLGETSEWLRQVVHQRAEEGGRVVGVPYAEGFRLLRLTG